MKYCSEILNKTFNTEQECIEAERAYHEEQKQKEAKKKALDENRKSRAKEVENALQEVVKARQHYRTVLAEFCKDYGAFHYSVSNPLWGERISDLFNWF